MNVLVFEFMAGGGVADQHPLDSSLEEFLRQGHSMLAAVCHDLLELEHDVVTLLDKSIALPIPDKAKCIAIERENDVDPSLIKAAMDADHVLVIAPESDGILLHYTSLLSSFSDRFISPDSDFVRLTSNKWDCHQWLTDRNVPCPETKMLEDAADVSCIDETFIPCVTKPVDGAGSEEVQLISSPMELEQPPTKTVLVQRFVEGIPASVSVIASLTEEPVFLEPGRQVFDAVPFGTHLRTEYPLEASTRKRALALARKTVNALPKTQGYFGIDMVIANDPKDDVVIEVNPRLTTSYMWLRKWSGKNLAAHFPIKQKRS